MDLKHWMLPSPSFQSNGNLHRPSPALISPRPRGHFLRNPVLVRNWGPGLASIFSLSSASRYFSSKLSITAPAFRTSRPVEVAKHHSSGCRPTFHHIFPGHPVDSWGLACGQHLTDAAGPGMLVPPALRSAAARPPQRRGQGRVDLLPLRGFLFIFRAPPPSLHRVHCFSFILEVLKRLITTSKFPESDRRLD